MSRSSWWPESRRRPWRINPTPTSVLWACQSRLMKLWRDILIDTSTPQRLIFFPFFSSFFSESVFWVVFPELCFFILRVIRRRKLLQGFPLLGNFFHHPLMIIYYIFIYFLFFWIFEIVLGYSLWGVFLNCNYCLILKAQQHNFTLLSCFCLLSTFLFYPISTLV